MKIAVGSDEAGIDMKAAIKQHLADLGHSVTDFGVAAGETALYPDVATEVALSVVGRDNERAVLMCGTGIGVAISANKVPGIRAAQAHDVYSAERAQKSNDAQILCLGARVIGVELAKTIVGAWVRSNFQGGPSTAKVQRIAEYERQFLNGEKSGG